MNASKLFAAVAAVAFAGSAFAAELPVASAAATSAVAAVGVVAPAGYAVKSLNVPVVSVQGSKSTGRTRSEVRAEAVEAVKNYRTTFQIQLDHLKG